MYSETRGSAQKEIHWDAFIQILKRYLKQEKFLSLLPESESEDAV